MWCVVWCGVGGAGRGGAGRGGVGWGGVGGWVGDACLGHHDLPLLVLKLVTVCIGIVSVSARVWKLPITTPHTQPQTHAHAKLLSK